MTGSLDIETLSARYASGAAKPGEVVRDIYRRINEIGIRPVWITLRDEADAVRAADAAPRGPLYGIPFAVKDNIDVAGMPTTCGCPAFAYTPTVSADVVAKLEAAGAIVIGKTNLDQFATGLVGTRSPYGIPASPFDADYISGGSSSGSAVAVARGLVSFALGTDTAGSGRVPAAFNNIVGLKPTKGVISTSGVVPACRTQDTVSIFALTVSDAAQVANIAQGFDTTDIYSRCSQNPFRPIAFAAGTRIGVPAQGLDFFGDNRAARHFEEAVTRLETLGAVVVPFDFTPFAQAAQLLYAGPWVAERLAAIGQFAERNAAEMDPTVAGIILGANSKTAVDAFEGFYALARFVRDTETLWQTFSAMLLPTTVTTYRIAEVLADPLRLNSILGQTTNFVNLMDLSALAVPAGFRDDGLPGGLTLVGRAFDDGRLLGLGDVMHRSLSDATLGATEVRLDQTSPIRIPSSDAEVIIAVVGAHLTGQPLNTQLTERGATLLGPARTAKGYSLYRLTGGAPLKPGLVFDGRGAGGVEVELWKMPKSAFGSFVALIPRPLGIGTVCLDDGREVKGFLCEAYAVASADNITHFGGWRAYLATLESA